jgi:salicylate hydroxylase
MSGSTKLEYAIIGGGISGMVLALALHQRGLSVTVYESAAKFGEIGAGVGFTENVVQAMHVCHDGIYEVFEKICTHNQWESKQHIWFDVYDASKEDETSEHIFGVPSNFGSAGIHRARFLEGLIQMMPEGMARNSKRFQSAEKGTDGRWEIKFVDGSTATADAVIGCDGIKSSVRRWMYGEDHPCTTPTYTYKYAYRALIPMKDAIGAIGEERAMNCTMLVRPYRDSQ